MAYSADSFVADEQPTTAKWNKLWTNDASFNDGTGIADDTILTRHVLDENITSQKLAEAFFRGRKRVISTNSQPTDQTIQYGWTYVQGDGTTTVEVAVTFPTAFSEAPMVFCNQMAARGTGSGVPDTTDDFTTSFATAGACYPDDITTSGFTASLTATTNFSSSFYFGVSWFAIGPV